MEDYFFLTAAVLVGLAIGSFLSVCIFRIPIGKGWDEEDLALHPGSLPDQGGPKLKRDQFIQSFSIPCRSVCPSCGHQLKWFHNIPFFSWLFLGGRCAFCRTPISMRYPLVEILSAVFAAASLIEFGLTPTALLIYVFCAALLVISFIDIDYYIIPNLISYPGTVLGLAAALVNQRFHIFAYPVCSDIYESLLGILAGAGFLWLVSEGYFRLRKREGLGLGDVKLLAMTGAFFGAEGAVFTIFVGSLFGAVIGISLILLSGRRFSHQLPFGPYLALGTAIYIFIGPEFLNIFGEALGGLFSWR